MIWIRTGGTSNGVSSMCDRPANGGDKLVSTSFPETPARGFAAADDRSVAVCLLPGTELSFDKEIRCEGVIFSWSPGHKVAKFQQVNKAKRHAYHGRSGISGWEDCPADAVAGGPAREP